MIDPAQIALLIVIIALTILLFILGIQVFFILRDFRKTVQKTNKILDNTDVITESIAGPASSVSSIVSGLKTGLSIANLLKRKKTKEE